MFCEKCGAKLDKGTLFCTKCGAKVEEENAAKNENPPTVPKKQENCCAKCGNKLEKGFLFCTKCGEKIETPAAAKSENGFDPRGAVEAASGYITAVRSNRKLLLLVGGVLAVILIVVMIIVISAISKAVSGSSGKVGGKKDDFYFDRRLALNDIVEFGEYEQDGNTMNGKEPIKWHVANIENDMYLLVSVNVLDCQAWDDGSASGGSGGLEHSSELHYDDSSVRSWLNNSFDKEAFGAKERKFIVPVSFRNDVITVDKNNEFGKDLAFLLNHTELELYTSTLLTLPAPISLNLLKNGSYGKVDDLSEIKDYSKTGWYGTWYIRDVNNSGKQPKVFYFDNDGSDGSNYSSTTSPGEKMGIRPAIYISTDACYRRSADEVSGDVEKMSQHQGKYIGGYKDITTSNFISIDFKQGFFNVDSMWPVAQDENLYEYFWFNRMDDSFKGRYSMEDFDYSKEKGNDCFTDESRGMKLVYDSKKDTWYWYMNIREGINNEHFPEEKTGQWLLFATLISEDEYNAQRK